MAGEATCPSCGTRVWVGEPARAVRCPGCGKPVLADAPSHTLAQSRPGYGAGGVGHPYLAPPQAADEIGRLSKYRVLGKLGEGGFGAVFEAEDTVLDRRVALKVMLPQHATDRVAKARFLREAKTQARVEHDHVVQIYEVGEDRGVPFLAMPLLKGRTLADDLARTPRPAMSEVLRVARETAEGLAAAHDKGLIHRDIKPNNVWLEGDRRRVKILDFGLARPEEPDKSPGAGTVTREGGVIGTPLYMSPEQSLGDKVDRRTDLFSLGVVLYQMATGELPFLGTNQLAILMAVTQETPTAPAVRNPDCPRALSDLVMRMLSKKAADRPGSAREVCEALQRISDEALRPAGPSGVRPALVEMASPAYAAASEPLLLTAAPRPARQTPWPPPAPTPPERRPLPDRVTAGADRDATRDDSWQPERDLAALRRAKRVGG